MNVEGDGGGGRLDRYSQVESRLFTDFSMERILAYSCTKGITFL